VPLDSANSRSIGIEASNSGVGEEWSPAMVESYEVGVAAMMRAYGCAPSPDVVAHFEWAPGRKIDPWGGNAGTPGFPYTGPHPWTMSGFRSGVAARLAPGPGPGPAPDDADLPNLASLHYVGGR
jgi:hypothetical protein